MKNDLQILASAITIMIQQDFLILKHRYEETSYLASAPK